MTHVQDQYTADSFEYTADSFETGWDKPALVQDRMAGWARLAAQMAAAPVGFVTLADGTDWNTSGVDQTTAGGTGLTLTQRVVADAIAQHVSVRCTALILPDVRKFWCGPATSPTLAAIQALLAVPVFTTGRLRPVAVIGAMDTRSRGWGTSHRYNLETLAVALSRALAAG